MALTNKPDCGVEIKTSTSAAGRGLFITRNVDRGEEIFSIARPLLVVLDSVPLQYTCDNCYVSSQDVKNGNDVNVSVNACSGCKRVKYCSKKCQSQAWKRLHKYECKGLCAAPETSIPTIQQAYIRLRLMLSNGLVDTNDDLPLLSSLESHVEDFYPQEADPLGKDNVADEHGFSRSGIFATIRTNALTLVTPTFDPLGMVLDPIMSIANHSCDPNAYVAFDGPRLSLRSLTPIKSGDELFISYIDTTNSRLIRCAELKQRYHFLCACSACKDTTSTRDGFGHMREPYNAHDQDRLWKCTMAEAEGIRDLQTALEAGLADSIKLLEKDIAKLKAHAWPLVRQPLPAYRHELFIRRLDAGDIGSAWRMAVTTHFYIDPVLYPEPWHPVRVVHQWTLVRVMLHYYSMQHDPAVQKIVMDGFDFVTVVWSLLTELARLLPRSHGKGQLLATVMRKIAEVDAEAKVMGLDLSQVGRERVHGQWRMLQGFADETLTSAPLFRMEHQGRIAP